MNRCNTGCAIPVLRETAATVSPLPRMSARRVAARVAVLFLGLLIQIVSKRVPTFRRQTFAGWPQDDPMTRTVDSFSSRIGCQLVQVYRSVTVVTIPIGKFPHAGSISPTRNHRDASRRSSLRAGRNEWGIRGTWDTIPTFKRVPAPVASTGAPNGPRGTRPECKGSVKMANFAYG
jgi:hypothetical protein